jgi:PTH1 family peptidyl-tRNA hydrolase
MKLIVGLGNPGKEYESTRHNIGYMVVDNIAKELNLTFDMKKKDALYTQTTIANEKVILLKPQRFINLSGEVVQEFIKYFKIEIDDILIISDDIDMEIGTYKLKSHGGSGGHNGLKNIELNLSTKNYKRLKIGISKNDKIEAKDYVLGVFTEEEKVTIEKVIHKTKDIVIDFVKMDFLNLMNKYNGL